MADCTRVQITKLSNVNYAVWSFKLRMLLVKEDVWDVVNGERPAQPDTVWLKRDGKAMATISLLVEDSQLVHIRTKESAKAMWDSLRWYHQKSTLSSKVFLYKRLYRMRLSDSGDMEVHVTAILDVIEQLTALGERLEDHMIVALLLCSLPDSFDTLVMALESRPEEDLTLELVKGKLIHEWNRRRESKYEESSSSAESSLVPDKTMAMTAQGTRKFPHHSKRKCYYCFKQGHIKADCRKFKTDQLSGKMKTTQQHQVNKVSYDSKDNGQIAFNVTHKQDPDSWYVDSGATCHMTNNLQFFTDFDENFSEQVYVADGRSLEAKGKGSGVLPCLDENRVSYNISEKRDLRAEIQRKSTLRRTFNWQRPAC